MGGGAEAEQSDAVARLDLSHAQAAEPDNPGTKERREFGGWRLLGKGDEKIRARHRVFGITAVHRIAGEGGVVAEIFAAFAAQRAGAVGAAQPGDADAHPRSNALSAGTELLHTADDL